jgi:pyruvate/2-oxoglutarate/acetoin dehydrogenase E1 component
VAEKQTAGDLIETQPVAAQRIITYAAAGIEALREEMRRDETIVYFGQGIGVRGGNFQQTRGLWAEFGEERLRDTPISELAQTGFGIGAAMAGSRPVVDIVFLDFLAEASGQIVQQASTIHHTSNGKFKVPLVVRAAMGGVRSSGPHHSHTFYSWFMHIPGLKIVARALEAAEILARQGISVEVVDPRTVAPLDKSAILRSVAKTGRLAIVDEAYATCGFSAEVAALVAEEGLGYLKAPVRRICTLPAPHTFSPSLDRYLVPSVERIVKEISELAAGSSA